MTSVRAKTINTQRAIHCGHGAIHELFELGINVPCITVALKLKLNHSEPCCVGAVGVVLAVDLRVNASDKTLRLKCLHKNLFYDKSKQMVLLAMLQHVAGEVGHA